MARIKSPDRMPTPTTARVAEFAEDVYALSPKYRSQALAVANAFSFEELFVVVHSMRRWYNGQTMAGALEAQPPRGRVLHGPEPSARSGRLPRVQGPER